MNPVVELKGVSKSFHFKGRPIHALNNVSFSVQKGQVVGIVGPNGAGKSTLIQSIMGFVQPDVGEIKVFDFVPSLCRSKFVRRIGILLDGNRNLSPALTGMQNLIFFGLMRNLGWKTLRKRIDDLAEMLQVTAILPKKCLEMSKGQRQAIQLLTCLLTDPELLILDEPTNGLDDQNRITLREILFKLKSESRTILIASHDFEWLEPLVSDVILLSSGRILTSGRIEHQQELVLPVYTWKINGELSVELLKQLQEQGVRIQRVNGIWVINYDGSSLMVDEITKLLDRHHSQVIHFSNDAYSLRGLYRSLIDRENDAMGE